MAPLEGVAVDQGGVAGHPEATPLGPLVALTVWVAVTEVGGAPEGTIPPLGGGTVEIAMMIAKAGTSQDYETSRGAGLEMERGTHHL